MRQLTMKPSVVNYGSPNGQMLDGRPVIDPPNAHGNAIIGRNMHGPSLIVTYVGGPSCVSYYAQRKTYDL